MIADIDFDFARGRGNGEHRAQRLCSCLQAAADFGAGQVDHCAETGKRKAGLGDKNEGVRSEGSKRPSITRISRVKFSSAETWSTVCRSSEVLPLGMFLIASYVPVIILNTATLKSDSTSPPALVPIGAWTFK